MDTQSSIFNIVRGEGIDTQTYRAPSHLQPCQRREGIDTHRASSSTLSKKGRDRHAEHHLQPRQRREAMDTQSTIFNLVKEGKGWTDIHRHSHLQPCQRREGMDTQTQSQSTIFNLVKEGKRWTDIHRHSHLQPCHRRDNHVASEAMSQVYLLLKVDIRRTISHSKMHPSF